jgi:single-stranded-DNA-specific exonuclease
MKSYRVREGVPTEVRAALSTHSELLQDLLFARGIANLEAAERFLYPEFERDSHDPFLLPDMEKAVERIRGAVRLHEKVSVWSDYDCDGVPGGVMLTDFLRKIGFEVIHYIPHRHKEGYGMNVGGIDELHTAGVTLIITIDLGTTEHEPIAYAKAKGIDVIVTDHHLVHAEEGKEILPEAAYAVINPKRLNSKYPFDGLCGAGVAWKLVQGILARERFSLPPGMEKWYLDLVGLATLSDMVPLVDENRMLARFGLLVMRKNRRPGISQLLSILRIKPNMLTEDDVGFMITPRINAASRMDSPDLAAKLLATKDWGEALSLAQKLNSINDERKGLVASIVKEVNKRMTQNEHEAQSPVIVMGSPNWRPGVLGLVANSLMQASGKPVFIWGREGGELLRGSCRSDGTVSVVDIMQGAGDVFDHFGGHTASGGFAVREERIHELAARLRDSITKLPQGAAAPEVLVDRQLAVAEVRQAHKELGALSPFGIENQKPLFLFPQVSISSVRKFGKAKDHVELTIEREGEQISGVTFFSTPDSYQKPVKAGDHADVVGHVETDWKGGPRLRIVDVI